MLAARASLTGKYLKAGDVGVEVGAGSRPFPVPNGVQVIYGDVRDADSLSTYFGGLPIVGDQLVIDAQTMDRFPPESLDFVLSGHVIEHLENPIGAILNTARVVKERGVMIVAVPEMTLTFDKNRPETSIKHLFEDLIVGGESTRLQAFVEHLTYVHPLMTGEILSAERIAWEAPQSVLRYKEFDIHYHAWSRDSFRQMSDMAGELGGFYIEAERSVENENIFVFRKGERSQL